MTLVPRTAGSPSAAPRLQCQTACRTGPDAPRVTAPRSIQDSRRSAPAGGLPVKLVFLPHRLHGQSRRRPLQRRVPCQAPCHVLQPGGARTPPASRPRQTPRPSLTRSRARKPSRRGPQHRQQPLQGIPATDLLRSAHCPLLAPRHQVLPSPLVVEGQSTGQRLVTGRVMRPRGRDQAGTAGPGPWSRIAGGSKDHDTPFRRRRAGRHRLATGRMPLPAKVWMSRRTEMIQRARQVDSPRTLGCEAQSRSPMQGGSLQSAATASDQGRSPRVRRPG